MKAQTFEDADLPAVIARLSAINTESMRLLVACATTRTLATSDLHILWNSLHDLVRDIEDAETNAEHAAWYATLNTQERAEYSLIQQNID